MHRLHTPTRAIVLGWLISLGGLAEAHDPGLSTAHLSITDGELTAELTFARRDIELLIPMDADQDGQLTPTEFAAAQPMLQKLACCMIEISSDGQRVAAELGAMERDESDALYFHLRFPAWVSEGWAYAKQILMFPQGVSEIDTERRVPTLRRSRGGWPRWV
jgi:hypothetical protein